MNMTLEQAVTYLKKVLKWKSFCCWYRKFALAITRVIEEYEYDLERSNEHSTPVEEQGND